MAEDEVLEGPTPLQVICIAQEMRRRRPLVTPLLHEGWPENCAACNRQHADVCDDQAPEGVTPP
jgi:hypothetical protein